MHRLCAGARESEWIISRIASRRYASSYRFVATATLPWRVFG